MSEMILVKSMGFKSFKNRLKVVWESAWKYWFCWIFSLSKRF